DPNEPMNPAFGLEMTVGVFSVNQKGYRFYSNFFPLLNIHRLRFVSAAFDPALIHPQQHVGPVTRFRSAGSGMNGNECVGTIIFAGKELPQFELAELVDQPSMLGGDVSFSLASGSVVRFFGGELLQRFEVADLAF